jgi:hypothetical protein
MIDPAPRRLKFANFSLPCVLVVLLVGCVTPTDPTTQPVTAIDPRRADPAYWLSQPSATSVTHRRFDELWQAAGESARDHRFRIDRADFRTPRPTRCRCTRRSA